jgi:hypothetical protein
LPEKKIHFCQKKTVENKETKNILRDVNIIRGCGHAVATAHMADIR